MIELERPVRRKVVTTARTPLVVALDKDGIWLREPRRRTAYLLPYGVAFLSAVRLHIAEQKRQKAAARKAGRAS